MEPDRQSTKTVARFDAPASGTTAARIRRARHVAAVASPPRRWADDLRDAGVAADDWISRRQSGARLYVHQSDQSVERLRERYPDLVRATVDAANRVLRHEFDLLGSGPYTPVDPDRAADETGYQPIDWYLDPVSGQRFPRGIPITQWNLDQMRPGRADIKLPWELSRCQHWPLLGQAYRLTRDDRFAVEIAHELHDFMGANPVGSAVNWACTRMWRCARRTGRWRWS